MFQHQQIPQKVDLFLLHLLSHLIRDDDLLDRLRLQYHQIFDMKVISKKKERIKKLHVRLITGEE